MFNTPFKPLSFKTSLTLNIFSLSHSSVSTPTPSTTPELNNLQHNGGNSTQDANTSQLEPMVEMVSECNPITNVVKTTIHTMATTLNCSSVHGAGGSGKHISLTVRDRCYCIQFSTQELKCILIRHCHKLLKFMKLL